MHVQVPLFSRYRSDDVIGNISVELVDHDENSMKRRDVHSNLSDEDRRLVADLVAMSVGRAIRLPMQRTPKKRKTAAEVKGRRGRN